MGRGWWWKVAVLVALVAAWRGWQGGGWDKEAAFKLAREWSEKLGIWAIPLYVSVHTVSIALCLPSAIFFETAAPLLFGFFPSVFCVFSAKVLAASLSFSIGRLVFRNSSTAVEWARRNRYFHLISRGVAQDGWKFVLLARFSPVPSYVINYTLAATEVGFLLDFLLPTAIGCVPMILQNTSIGSLAGAAVATASGSKKSQIWSYFFPAVGILSSVLISLRIKKYSTQLSVSETSPGKNNTHDS
ncbi:SNARE associated Golgi protein [Spatholobus suberectus]|nr:SNARE associated Golgi protein [Spatholobus suberectus]